MLRFSPTRIHLTRGEFDGLDERIQARHSARLARPRPSNVRLSPGPARSTGLSVVPADQNVGRQRAASSSSDVVVEIPQCSNKSAKQHEARADLSGLQKHAARTLGEAADLDRSPTRTSPSRASPPRRHDSLNEELREIEQIEREIAEHSPASQLDGVHESELGPLPPITPFRSLALDTQPRALSRTRARRRHARSSEDPGVHHQGIRPFSTQSQMWLDPVPQLVLPTGPSQPALSLDPGAPVFVPRTRFGTAETSQTEDRPWRSSDHSSSSNLRVRSSGELNIEPVALRRPQHRQRSRTSDQNAFPAPSPNLERYPLLRPIPDLAAPWRARREESSSTTHQPQDYQIRHTFTPSHHSQLLGPPSTLDLGLRPRSPALSMSSRSTPNLLNPPLRPSETHTRGSSLSWRIPSSSSPLHRMPGSLGSTRQSSREGLDAAAEFLRMRNSPLDDLTERLSRLSAGRQRSVGRSWERPAGRGRVSLLSGDPFRQEPNESPVRSAKGESLGTTCYDADDDPVAVAMALPPSSPLASSSQALPSTPPTHTDSDTTNPRSPLAQRSPKKPMSSPPQSIARKPVPSSSSVQATPKVMVYDDARSPTTQPQTPADLGRSARRARTRSNTTVQQSPPVVDRALVASLGHAPRITERHPYRNTYPPAPEANVAMAAGAVSHERARRPTQTQRSGENDDIESALTGLEHDRRTWIARRQNGGLDVTPPREGRFERYLS